MIVGSATAGSDWFLNGIQNLQSREATTERQLSSGYRIQDAADSPSQTPELIQLGSTLAQAETWQTNLTRVQTEASAADGAIATGIKLMDSALTLATQGASSTATAADRQNLAAQVQGIQQQMVSLTGTTVEGRYIFGGDQDQSAPYQLNAASATGVDKLSAQSATRTIVDPQGQTTYQSRTAQQIFDAAGNNGTFSALQSLANALQSNDQNGITTAIDSLQSASAWLNQQQGYYGTQEQNITSSQNAVANQITALKSQISSIRDTDVAQAATDLTQEAAAQTAAMSAQAEISRKSLFDYLG